jgi:hypothetical protein
MRSLTLEQHRARIANLDEARSSIKKYFKEYRVNNYQPGNVSYYLGAYPLPFSIEPTEYDYRTLKRYAEYGISIIKLHEEWNDSIRVLGANKYSSHDKPGMLKFIELCHYFGLKVIPYVSSGYIHFTDPDFKPEFTKYERYCSGHYHKYRMCNLASPEWRTFLYNKMMYVMDEYGVDGIYNDHPPDEIFQQRELYSKKYNKELPPEEVPYDPYTEDFLAMLYTEVKQRGGTYILHLFYHYQPPCKVRVYDYLNVGEAVSDIRSLLYTKRYEPHVINILDKKYQSEFGPDLPFVATIPFLQFPRLNHGRVVTQDVTTADVPFYDVKEDSEYHFWKKLGEYVKAHPKGPYCHGEFSSIPDDPEDLDRYGRYLLLYLPMVSDNSVVHMEIRDTSLIVNPIRDDVIVSLFTNEKQYMVISNLGDEPYNIILTHKWRDRQKGERGCNFTVRPKNIIFLEKMSCMS